ncbi:MAG TPA: FAD-dependent oxidoreductase, partial [Caulobacteraceae bacterium]|nr:FAD-dependent oxidoreductase [Caulobacteraceae bacterium]
MRDDFDVAIVGAGAAGLAAARRLSGHPLTVVVLEARDRTG